ncbi:hypothetical protein LOK49_LG08G01828 [Camellia lanceoleosa]|uniref:Uncharacterized protein n=1 Tax=Camellia lanceoleosa TaxID=1840588 RepID=A0ACC0GXG6_9ERIC|nr:hypothetical protein LOK49_LG08G01828 [Camellia lanceoleosa]
MPFGKDSYNSAKTLGDHGDEFAIADRSSVGDADSSGFRDRWRSQVGRSERSAVWRSLVRSLRCVAARAEEIDRISPSPPLSPRMGLMRPDLSVACQALIEAAPAEEVVVVREYKEGGAKVKGKGVPVYVMMPLDSVTMENTVNKRKAMNVSLQAMNTSLLYEKKDLLPTLHFSGLRSLHCINKRSLLCFSLVEGIHSVNELLQQ